MTFRTRGDQTATLHPHEFLRRFLLPVLPNGFMKLRHCGLLGPGNVNTRLAAARVARRRSRAPLTARGDLDSSRRWVAAALCAQ